MANTTIPVSIDALGNITCPDVSVAIGDIVTWSVTWASAQGTITVGPTPGKASPFTSLAGPNRGNNNQWTATVGSAGDYNIGDTAGKVRTPKIAIIAPMLEKNY